jgi:hypothetical protein
VDEVPLVEHREAAAFADLDGAPVLLHTVVAEDAAGRLVRAEAVLVDRRPVSRLACRRSARLGTRGVEEAGRVGPPGQVAVERPAGPVGQQLSALDVEHVDRPAVCAADGLHEGDSCSVRRRRGEHEHLVARPRVGIQHRLQRGALAAAHHQLELLVVGVRLPEELASVRPGPNRPRQPRVARRTGDRRPQTVTSGHGVEHRARDGFLRRDPLLGRDVVEPLQPGVRIVEAAAVQRVAAVGIASCGGKVQRPRQR